MDEILKTLSSASSEAWLGIIGVIIGTTLSILGVWLTNQFNIKQLVVQLNNEKAQKSGSLKREKLEELYTLVSKWFHRIFAHYLKLTLVMRGEIDYNQYLDIVIKDGKEKDVDFSRLEMIIDIYGPELIPSFNKIMEVRSELNDIAAAHRKAYNAGNLNGERFLKPYGGVQIKLEELTKSFKKEIAEYAKNA